MDQNSETCDRHGNPAIKSFNVDLLEKTFYLCQVCIDEDKENEKESSEETPTQREQRCINHKLHNAMISPRFLTKTLDNYKAGTDLQKKALQAAMWFIKHFEFSTGLIFIGSPGTGKNHLACGIIQEIIKTDKTAILTTTMKMIRAIKDSWTDRDIKEGEVIALYTQPDLLVIDEIGVQFGSDTEKLYISEIINDRYEAMKPTILLGNISRDELIDQMGDRVIDRFRENGKLIIFNWESYRGKT